ncbi:hypothetical protein G7Z17_g1361 [Cylindrodendrum hubeiense]|uniref:Hydrophobin n=1 Tax=Cylindrodendrum hubeiense TaxID=595255 RepID=A0A9P5HG72_9HYPO|nr:hypothetical protein G7Z17_g1361 [Cylindrodendrum hubeiense]
MHFSAVFYGFAFWQLVMASPVAGPLPASEIDPRDLDLPALAPRADAPPVLEGRSVGRRTPTAMDIPFPRFPARNRDNNGGKGGGGGGGGKNNGNNKDCASTPSTSTQSNLCSAGNPYCCSSDGNGACQQTVICCNNNNGFQICIGDLDFNVPITINIYT